MQIDLNAATEPKNKKRERHKYTLPKDSLSPREAEVCMLLREGLMVKEIAYKLSISFHTADAHVRKVYEKLNVRSRAELFKHFDTNPHVEVRSAPRESDVVRILERLDAIDRHLLDLEQTVWARYSQDASGIERPGVPAPVTAHRDFFEDSQRAG